MIDERIAQAREFLTAVRTHKIADLSHSDLVREAAELRRQLGDVLDFIGEEWSSFTDEPSALDDVMPERKAALLAALPQAVEPGTAGDAVATFLASPALAADAGLYVADWLRAVREAAAHRERTRAAATAITRAARCEHDFAGWLAAVLAVAAGNLGGSDALVEGRPGSWEADLVMQLVHGTAGYDDKHLPGPSGRAKLTDAQVRGIRWRYDGGTGGVTQQEVAAEFGVSASTISDITTGRTWAWLGDDR